MADSTLTLDIVTPTGPIAAAAGVQTPGVEIPGILGELGVLPNHVPFVSPVVPGVVRFRAGDSSVRVAVGRGFVEVSESGRVTVLADQAVEAGAVDHESVKGELDEVRKELSAAKEGDPALRATLADREAWLEAQLRAAAN